MATVDTSTQINITIKAMDEDWEMGPTLKLTLEKTLTVNDLVQKIKEIKGIPISRMNLFLPPARVVDRKKWDNSLMQNSIYDKGNLIIRPSTKGCWMWEPIEYYWERTLEDIASKVDAEDGTSLETLEQKVVFPYPMKRSGVVLSDFMRKYPEVFQMEVNTRGEREIHCRLNEGYKLPTWT